MNSRTSIARIALYIKILYLQKSSKAIIQYLIIAMIFIASASLPNIQIFSLFPTILHFVILLYVSKSFEEFHDRKTSSLMLTLPASSFEKYSGIFLFYFFNHVILSVIILFLSQLLAHVLAEVVSNHYYSTLNSWDNASLLGRLQENETVFSNIVSETGYFFHKVIGRFGYFFLFAILCKKNQFIKAFLMVLALYSFQIAIMFMIRISKTQSGVSHYFYEYSMPYHESIFMIGSILCIIIGYFRFSKTQYC